MQNMCPKPSTTVKSSSSGPVADQAQKPAADMSTSAAPIQAAWLSLPRSMKRPSDTAENTGNSAKPAEMTPSHTTGRPSSMVR